MKSSDTLPIMPLLDRGGSGRSPVPETLERDAREDEDAAHDLEGVEGLREQDEREEDREERLQVAEERGSRGPDTVDRREPEDVREEQRADDRVAEAEPRFPAEGEVLRRELRDADERERDPADREHEGADPERRVPAHERRDRDRVPRPGERRPDRDHIALESRRQAAGRARGNEADAGEGYRGAEPEGAGEMLEPERERDQADEHRGRPEQERDRRGMCELDPVDEGDLVEEDHQRREEDQPEVASLDPKRAFPAVREDPEEDDRGEIADRPVRERRPAVGDHVLRDGDVQRPEEHRPQEHGVDGAVSAHAGEPTVG